VLQTFPFFLLLSCVVDVTPPMYRHFENVRTVTKLVCMTLNYLVLFLVLPMDVVKVGPCRLESRIFLLFNLACLNPTSCCIFCGVDVTPRIYQELENVRTITKLVCMTHELFSSYFVLTYGFCKSGATVP